MSPRIRALIITAWFCMIPAGAALLAQAEPPAPPPPEGSAPFTITRMVVCAALENREPVGTADSFPESVGKVFCFIEAKDIQADTTITVVWTHGDKEVNRTELELKQGPRWRTNAVKTVTGMSGDWEVSVLDADGKSVQSVSFKIE